MLIYAVCKLQGPSAGLFVYFFASTKAGNLSFNVGEYIVTTDYCIMGDSFKMTESRKCKVAGWKEG